MQTAFIINELKRKIWCYYLDEIFSVTPITLRVEVTKLEVLHLTERDFSDGASDFASDEGLTTTWAFVVEKDSVAGVHVVSFAIVGHDPVCIQLGNTWKITNY